MRVYEYYSHRPPSPSLVPSSILPRSLPPSLPSLPLPPPPFPSLSPLPPPPSPSLFLPPSPSLLLFLFLSHASTANDRSRDLNSDLHDCVSSTWLRHRPSSKIGDYCCGWLACFSACWLWVLECFSIKHIYERVWLLFPEHLHLFYLRQKYLSGLIP